MKKIDLESFPTSESAKKMLSYVTAGFYDKSYVGKWLYQVMGIEYDAALRIAEELPAQFFPETATWGLMYHEIKWGLPVRDNLSYDERRRLIFNKRDCKSPMTPYRMEEYLSNAVGFNVHIADVNDSGRYGFVADHPNCFKVYLTGEGTPDYEQVFNIINRLKQSHTTYNVNHRIELYISNSNYVDVKNVCYKVTVCMSNENLNVDLRIQTEFKATEKVSAYIVTKTNYWTLNGEYLLDGTKNLNAGIKEEKL